MNLWSEKFYDVIEVPKEDITEDDEDSEEETQVDMVWTEKGTKFGHKFLNCIIEIDRVLKKFSPSRQHRSGYKIQNTTFHRKQNTEKNYFHWKRKLRSSTKIKKN